MRLQSCVRISSVIVIAILMGSSGGSVAHAQSPTPVTKSPAARAASRANNQFSVFLPFVDNASPLPVNWTPKKGAALTYQDCSSAAAVNAVWEYGWSPSPSNCVGIENIPMLWGAGDVNATLGGNSQWIMGFNEPDFASQANISPSNAATLWRQIEQKYPTRKLLAPAPSGGNTTWLPAFRQSYISAYGSAPRLDGLAVHCYAWQGSACIQYTQTFESLATSWGVPEVWVTEFSLSPAAPNTPNQSLLEAQTYINWMESDPMITHYAWFASKIQGTEPWALSSFMTQLVDWNTGQLTTFGRMYIPFR
jgi:hypothetical protein